MGQRADQIRIEIDRGSGWESNLDAIADSIRWRSGCDGSGPKDGTAGTGTLRFQLRNDAGNSVGLMGSYSPGHPDCLSGFDVGAPARLVIRVSGVDYPQWTGTIGSITPMAGKKGPRRTTVTCVDWMEEAAKAEVRGLSLLTNAAGNTAITSLVALVDKAPVATSFDAGVSTFAYLFDQVGPQAKVLQEIARVTQSEMGQCFIKKNGTLRWQNRSTRTALSSSYTFTDTMSGLEAVRDRKGLINKVTVTIHPRKLGDVGDVLYFSDAVTPISAGETLTVDSAYQDPDMQAANVGGRDMIAFTATTDYLANSLPDGTGTNHTASMVTTGTFFGANSARFVIQNTTGVTVYITKLQCRGTALKDYAPLSAFADNFDSQTEFGVNPVEIDLWFESNIQVAQGLADQILALFGGVVLMVPTLHLQPNRNSALLAQAVTRELSDQITVQETVTGIDQDYFINGIEGRVTGPKSFETTWTLTPADAGVYFIWNTSLWNTDTRWGFA